MKTSKKILSAILLVLVLCMLVAGGVCINYGFTMSNKMNADAVTFDQVVNGEVPIEEGIHIAGNLKTAFSCLGNEESYTSFANLQFLTNHYYYYWIVVDDETSFVTIKVPDSLEDSLNYLVEATQAGISDQVNGVYLNTYVQKTNDNVKKQVIAAFLDAGYEENRMNSYHYYTIEVYDEKVAAFAKIVGVVLMAPFVVCVFVKIRQMIVSKKKKKKTAAEALQNGAIAKEADFSKKPMAQIQPMDLKNAENGEHSAYMSNPNAPIQEIQVPNVFSNMQTSTQKKAMRNTVQQMDAQNVFLAGNPSVKNMQENTSEQMKGESAKESKPQDGLEPKSAEKREVPEMHAVDTNFEEATEVLYAESSADFSKKLETDFNAGFLGHTKAITNTAFTEEDYEKTVMPEEDIFAGIAFTESSQALRSSLEALEQVPDPSKSKEKGQAKNSFQSSVDYFMKQPEKSVEIEKQLSGESIWKEVPYQKEEVNQPVVEKAQTNAETVFNPEASVQKENVITKQLEKTKEMSSLEAELLEPEPTIVFNRIKYVSNDASIEIKRTADMIGASLVNKKQEEPKVSFEESKSMPLFYKEKVQELKEEQFKENAQKEDAPKEDTVLMGEGILADPLEDAGTPTGVDTLFDAFETSESKASRVNRGEKVMDYTSTSNEKYTVENPINKKNKPQLSRRSELLELYEQLREIQEKESSQIQDEKAMDEDLPQNQLDRVSFEG